MLVASKFIPRKVISVALSSYFYPQREREWEKGSSLPLKCIIPGIASPITLFSTVEFSHKHEKFEPKVIDPSHILTNVRRLVLNDSIEGIRMSAWEDVATKDNDILNMSLVKEPIADKQNVEFAQCIFSEEVQSVMEENGDAKEAEFVLKMRDWYDAIDKGGLEAIDRVKKLLALRDYLLSRSRFTFPPSKSSLAGGFSQVTFHGLVMNVDTRIHLYSLSNKSTYNHRSIGTLSVESFFGDLTSMAPTGCPRSVDIPSMIATVTEMNNYRLNPEGRCFAMATKKTTVYPTHELEDQNVNGNVYVYFT